MDDLDLIKTDELKVAYIIYVGKSSDNKNIYHFLLSENVENTFTEEWAEKPAGNIPTDLLLIDDSQYEYIKELKTDITLDLAQNNTCFSMQDCRDKIVAIAYENLDNEDFYPEPLRIVIHFGDNISDVEKMFAKRNMSLKDLF